MCKRKEEKQIIAAKESNNTLSLHSHSVNENDSIRRDLRKPNRIIDNDNF